MQTALTFIIYSNISNFLENNNIFTPRQQGFRRGHSCEIQLILSINDHWVKSLDKDMQTDITIFDFSKAFGSVPDKRLLVGSKAMALMGILLVGYQLSSSIVLKESYLMGASLHG